MPQQPKKQGYLSIVHGTDNRSQVTMTYLSKALDLYLLIGEGKVLMAFRKYYHRDVVMIKANGERWQGEEANREFEKKWVDPIREIHASGVNAISSYEEDNMTIVEAWMDVTLQNGQRIKMEEIARQTWRGDQIVEERFFPKNS
jgi:hypothetical protein